MFKYSNPEDRGKPWSLERFNEGTINQGRFRVWLPDHPRAYGKDYVLRSIAAYEAYHGVKVPRDMIIHHIDGDTLNDSKENLEMMSRKGKRSHSSHHNSGENHPMFGVTGADHHLWKGDSVTLDRKYERALAAKRRAIEEGTLTPEVEEEYKRTREAINYRRYMKRLMRGKKRY